MPHKFLKAQEKPISYNKAIKSPDKQGLFHNTTLVRWNRQAHKDASRININLYTLGEGSIIFPPPLPKGYAMEDHPACCVLAYNIYSREKAKSGCYDFDYLTSVMADEDYMFHLGIYRSEILDFNLHPEFALHFMHHEEAWDKLEFSVENLFNFVANLPRFQWGVEQGWRLPPSKLDVIKEALQLAEIGNPEDWFIGPDKVRYYALHEKTWNTLWKSLLALFGLIANRPVYKRAMKQEWRSPDTLVNILRKMLQMIEQEKASGIK